MPIARWKDLGLDVVDLPAEREFWARVLGLTPDGAGLSGPTPAHRVRLDTVTDPPRVKNRVHVDVLTPTVEELVALGARPLSEPGQFRWTVLADPEGIQFCAFVREDPPPLRLYEIVVDVRDAEAQATWWSEVWGGRPGAGEGYAWVEDIPGTPFDNVSFVPVPEPKTATNRVRWDVTVDGPDGVAALVDRGARVLQPSDDATPWTVLADPEGNEFRALPA